MADITIHIPVSREQEVLDAFASHYGYEEAKIDTDPPLETWETKGAFAKRMLIAKMMQIVRVHKLNLAYEQPTIDVDADLDLILLS